MGRVKEVDQAIEIIKDGDTVAISGFVGAGHPEYLLTRLEEHFAESGKPRNLTIVFAAGQGDKKERGLNHLAHAGLVKKVIGGHFAQCPKLSHLVMRGQIEGYNFPQGVLVHLFRDIASGKPGTITHLGLNTFVDPRRGGGKLNSRTTEDLVELVHLADRDWLWYKSFPIDVALLRGTTADGHCNVSSEREAMKLEVLSMAQAARNSGGSVIVQVENVVPFGKIAPKEVVIPGILVDAVVISPPEHHWQTFATPYDPSFAGEERGAFPYIEPLPLNERKVVCRRAAMELRYGDVVNLGIGMPEGVAAIAAEEGILDRITLTTEAGTIGGIPASGMSFGASRNPEAIIDQPYQFDFYDGGGIDIAILGMAQVDRYGNVNVGKFGSRLAGVGGFINISQNAKRLIFAGTLNYGGARFQIAEGEIQVLTEGSGRKFVQEVEQVDYSGAYGIGRNQEVLYITERCVFRLTGRCAIQLIEVAPGIEPEKDVFPFMDFRPAVHPRLGLMNPRIFHDVPMGLASIGSDQTLKPS